MNHGSFDKASLLSNLLGAAGNYPASAKRAVSNTQTDSAQGFQDAMQKARPEIAGREAIAAKRSEPIKRSEPARRAEPNASVSREKLAKSTQDARARNSVAKTQQDTRVQSARVDRDVAIKHANTAAQRELSNGETIADESRIETESARGAADLNADTEATAKTDKTDTESLDPTLVTDAVIGEEGAVNENPLLALFLAEPINPEKLTVDGEITKASLLTATAGLGDSEMLDTATEDIAIKTEAILMTPGVVTEAATLGESAAVAGLTVNVTQGAGALASIKDIAALPAGLNSNANLAVDAETVDLSLSEFQVVDAASETEADSPESFMGTKAAFGKLLEASLLNAGDSGDKAVSTPDGAKLIPTPTSGNPALDVLSRLSEAQTSPAARAFVVQTGVNVPVGQPQWSQAVGDKVLWLAAQNVSVAEIRLDPPDLGPMSVKVSVNQDQATVSFTSPHPIVREALDQQLNRLREMFAEQGLNLVNVDVSDKSFAQQEREKNESGKGSGKLIDDEDDLQPVAATSLSNMRLVDHYA